MRISLVKQLPPNPGPDFKNLLPILESIPIAFETSLIFAPVTSQIAAIELIELIRCAKNAFAVNFDSSELHKFVLRILLSLMIMTLLPFYHHLQSKLYLDSVNHL